MEDALREIQPSCDLARFMLPSRALKYAESSPVDVAFLDIELGSTNGLILAKQLKDMQPELHIIFVTAHAQYALDAFQLHATGYLMKPVTSEQLRRELTFLYGRHTPQAKVRVQTFGGFDVFVDQKRLIFGRSKAKELLAYLVDRQGSSVTTGEACAVLWEESGEGKRSYFRTLVKELRRVLHTAGVEDILIRRYNCFAIDPDRLECDSYRFMRGDPEAVNHYRHDYMPYYSWAEFTVGTLEDRLEDYRKKAP